MFFLQSSALFEVARLETNKLQTRDKLVFFVTGKVLTNDRINGSCVQAGLGIC